MVQKIMEHLVSFSYGMKNFQPSFVLLFCRKCQLEFLAQKESVFYFLFHEALNVSINFVLCHQQCQGHRSMMWLMPLEWRFLLQCSAIEGVLPLYLIWVNWPFKFMKWTYPSQAKSSLNVPSSLPECPFELHASLLGQFGFYRTHTGYKTWM